MPRSGTTLISSILDAHSNIAISPETHFYTRCHPESIGEQSAVEAVWACLQQQPGIQDMGLSDEERRAIRQRIQSVSNPTPADLLRAVETTYAARSGAQAWGEKTPDHLPHVPRILRDFPDAVVLAVIRDPRDVCRSLRGMPWSRDSLPESAWKWRQYARKTEEYEDEYPKRFREVRYEDVLENPEALIRSLLEWLDAPFEEAVLSFHQRDAGPADPDREPWKEKTQRPIDPSNKEKWRDQMTVGARVLVEWLTAPGMDSKGYRRARKNLGLPGFVSLARELGIAAGIIVRRLWRQWRMPSRTSGNHTPVWMRERNVFSEEED